MRHNVFDAMETVDAPHSRYALTLPIVWRVCERQRNV